MALGSKQLLAEMMTTDLPWGLKAAGAYHLHVLQTPWALGAYVGLYRESFIFYSLCTLYVKMFFSFAVLEHTKLFFCACWL
jgi:hypothetical protein